MALQTTTNISVDFYDKKYILINAKQYDRNSRFLSLTCYNHGESCPLNEGEHSAYIRYKKSDNNSVFNFCEIDRKGNIIVELTEQMLASEGVCYADLVVVNEGSVKVDSQTGEIISIENNSILSTMPIHIDVTGTAVENSDIESSYEFSGLNTALEKAEAEYTEVMKTSKSWAVGGTGIRDGEDTNNSKYWSTQSSNSASAANTSALNAANSELLASEHMHDALVYSQNSQTYMGNAKTYMENAKTSEQNAKTSEQNAQTYMTNASVSEQNAKISETNASVSEQNAKTSEENSKTYMDNAKTHMDNAKINETNSLNNANKAKSYAVGGTGTRDNEDEDNAYYYYELVKTVIEGVNNAFVPMGTISFSELSNIEKMAGYVYNMSDDFVTDDTFREGAGKSYTAGTNVYYTANGYWDCLGGAAYPTATVNEVKEYLGIE